MVMRTLLYDYYQRVPDVNKYRATSVREKPDVRRIGDSAKAPPLVEHEMRPRVESNGARAIKMMRARILRRRRGRGRRGQRGNRYRRFEPRARV